MQTVKVLVQKDGNTPEECEDSLKVKYFKEEKLLMAVVSDGASQGYESGEFSAILCSEFIRNNGKIFDSDGELSKKGFMDFLKGARIRFEKRIFEKTKDRVLKWYEENAIATGAFATFMGIALDEEKGEVKVISVGDCFIFHIKLCTSTEAVPEVSIYPDNILEASNTPYLLSTENRYNEKVMENVIKAKFSIEVGDVLLMATDAFSYFLIENIKSEKWEKVSRTNEEQLKSLINSGRKQGKLKNDDVAIIKVRF